MREYESKSIGQFCVQCVVMCKKAFMGGQFRVQRLRQSVTALQKSGFNAWDRMAKMFGVKKIVSNAWLRVKKHWTILCPMCGYV